MNFDRGRFIFFIIPPLSRKRFQMLLDMFLLKGHTLDRIVKCVVEPHLQCVLLDRFLFFEVFTGSKFPISRPIPDSYSIVFFS